MRPDVVLFGEMLPEDVFGSRRPSAPPRADVCFVVGTSAIVYPAAGLPASARRAGAFLVEVNPEETPLSGICDVTLRGPRAKSCRVGILRRRVATETRSQFKESI